MTNQLTSKFSLYDILSMILPGCVWLWCGKIIFSGCDWAIVKEAQKIIENWSDSHDKIWIVAVFLAAGYIVGLLAEIMIGGFWRKFIANNECCIECVFQKKKNNEGYQNIRQAQGDTVVEKYYFAYEYVRQNSKHFAVEIIESQVAMLRNTRWPASILIGLFVHKAAASCCHCTCHCNCAVFWGFICGVIVWCLMYAFTLLRQQKVYAMIFDYYEYMLKIDNTNKK